jgi:hypothetical protein
MTAGTLRTILRPIAPRRWCWALGLLLVAAACAHPSTGSTGGGPPQSVPALKLDVLAAVGGRLSYCDPDLYPVARGDPLQNAKQRFPTIQADRPAFVAILAHEHLSAAGPFTDQQLIAINDDFKQLQAIDLHPSGDGYGFSVSVPKAGSSTGVELVAGTVSRSGQVTIGSSTAGTRPPCPVCLASGSLIDTPNGPVPVQDLRVGMAVWSTDLRGHRITATVRETGHMAAPLGHEVVRLTLADGRTVLVSPGHPTADGRLIGQLRAGDRMDGSRVVSAVRIPYAGVATYDLLPSGPTGTYFAGGVLLGSTLRRTPPRVVAER